MARRDVILKAALVLLIVWAVVWGIRAYAGSKKITAERLDRQVAAARFADWSDQASPPDRAEAACRVNLRSHGGGLVYPTEAADDENRVEISVVDVAV